MSRNPSKSDLDSRSEQLNPTSPRYYRDRGYSREDANALAELTQQRHEIQSSHQNKTNKREHD